MEIELKQEEEEDKKKQTNKQTKKVQKAQEREYFCLTSCPHFSMFISNLGVVSGTL